MYVSEYRDEWISFTDHLWDNQYVYDQLIEAANRNGTEIITHLDQPENADRRTFQLGDMQLKIISCENYPETAMNIKRELPSCNERNLNTGFDEWKPNLDSRLDWIC